MKMKKGLKKAHVFIYYKESAICRWSYKQIDMTKHEIILFMCFVNISIYISMVYMLCYPL